ncbi:NUDIX domain-containing protein [Humisphaera borealis]|uniref:NUDIX domain-containing protein n=2 Tax=Humisphaera borealis TaxID=2807512 RepID=A0A7M2X3R8_9BACT|nr:NUDIX domain-containing protein [Humisphaera borealis]
MQEYACGFLFSEDRSRVLLIRKRRPAWQAGKLNGVGGKIEPGETPLQAMRREFREEAGVDIADWQQVLRLSGPDWVGHFFRAFGNVGQAYAVTDELLELHKTASLPKDTIPNLQWMIPILLDDEVASGLYAVAVTPSVG